jgi:hypothetical protein
MRRDQIKSLWVEYNVRAEPLVEPIQVAQWRLMAIRDYHERYQVGFSGDKRLLEVHRPAPQLTLLPADQLAPDPLAPASLAQIIHESRKSAVSRKTLGDFDYLIAIAQQQTERTMFDGQQCFTWNPGRDSFVKSPPEAFSGPILYLANLGLRPLDPGATGASLQRQKQRWFPDNFDLYRHVRIRPETQSIDGAPCIVLQGEQESPVPNDRQVVTDTLWLDPDLGYAPRQREQRRGDMLTWSSRNADFREFAPGCWLPLESQSTIFAPQWAAEEYRGRPALRFEMTLRMAKLNDQVNDDAFAAPK